jgi:glutamine amidotransferase PdxT
MTLDAFVCGDKFQGCDKKKEGVLCLVDETVAGLRKLGVEAMEVRKPEQLEGLAGLIIPGGESTTMAKLAEHYHLVSHNLTLKSNFPLVC